MRRLGKALRYLGFAAMGVILLVAALGIYVVYFFDWNSTRGRIGTTASRVAHREITLGGDLTVDWDWPTTRVVMRDVHVANIPQGSEPTMLDLERLVADIELRALLHFTLHFTRLEFARPKLLLEKTRDGRDNWTLGDNPAGAVALAPLPDERGEFPVIDALIVDDGRITYRNAESGTEVTVRAATVAGAAQSDAGSTHFEGGGVMRGERFRFDIDGGSILSLRESKAPFPLEVNVHAGATHARIRGTLADPLRSRDFDLELSIAGENAADLFPLTGIALLPSPPYQLTGRLGHGDRQWTFKGFRGRMGQSDLAGDLTWDKRGPRPLLTARFESQELDFADLRGFIGARTPRPDDPRVIPDVPLDITRLSAMDAQVDFIGHRLVATRMPLDAFQAHFDLRDRVLTVDPLRFDSGSGDVSLRLVIDARETPLNTALRARVSRVPLAELTAGASSKLGEANLTRGYIGGTIELDGTGPSLRDMLARADGAVSLGMEGGQVSLLLIEMMGLDVAESVGYLVAGDKPVPVRCLIADFAVQKGDMQVRTLVFDTDDTVVRGQGGLDLGDERLTLELKAAPKDFSPLVLRAPLEVKGTLKHPAPHVSKRGLIGRGMAAAVLAVVAPPAAILAFIEPGLGKDSQCHALIGTMAGHSRDPAATRSLVPTTPSPPSTR